MRRRFSTFFAVLVTALALGGTGTAQAAHETHAQAVNNHDNSTIIKIAFDFVHITDGHPVDSENAAVAISSCSSCRTVAIAIQIVLASGSPAVVVPENVAVALNVNCNTCQTLADAYQFVYTGSTEKRLTHEGEQQIHDIQHALQELEHSNLSLDEIQAQVVQYAAQIQQIMQTQLVPAHGPGSEEDQKKHPPDGTQTMTMPIEIGTTPTTGTDTTPTDTTETGTGTGTETTPTNTGTGTGTETTPTDTGTGTQTTPTDTGTGTETTQTDTGTQTTPGG